MTATAQRAHSRRSLVTEPIQWHPLPHHGMPDADISCLLEVQNTDDGSVRVLMGWWSGEHWIEDASGDRIERIGPYRVVAWADEPAGSLAMAGVPA